MFRAILMLLLLLIPVSSIAQTNRFLWWIAEGLPSRWRVGGQGTSDRLVCVRKETILGITNATKIGFLTSSAPSANTVLGFAIYDEDGTSIITITHQEATWTAAHAYLKSSLGPFSIAPGDWTYTCWCTSNTSGSFATYPDITGADVAGIWNFNSSALLFGYADETCTSGVPPSSIVASSLNTRSISDPNILLVFMGTDTP